jgi:hypothetical protein
MNEEAVNLIFDWAVGNGYKGTKEEWLNYIQTNDDAFDYVYDIAKRRGYQKDQNSFGTLMGRTAPIAKTEPAKTEVATTTTTTTTEPAKTEPAKIETATTTTTPAKPEPAVTVAAETAPAKTEVVAETKVEPQITVKEVEAPVKEEPKKELPVSTGLIPVTEKTEVKAVETPSDKMVIKSDKKIEQPVTVEEKVSNEIFMPYGKSGPEVYYDSKNNQYVIGSGSDKSVAKAGTDKYNEIDGKVKKIAESAVESQTECPGREKGCAINEGDVSKYFNKKYGGEKVQEEREDGSIYEYRINKKPESNRGYIVDSEGNLANFIDGGDDKNPTPINKKYFNEKYNHESLGFYFVAEEAPKSKRFTVYKPFGEDGESFIFDNKTEVIMQETEDKVITGAGRPMTTWLDIPMNTEEYKKAKTLISSIKSKKSQGVKK